MREEDIVKDILSVVQRNAPPRNFSGWYVGITDDVERRLFGEHKVQRDVDAGFYIYRDGDDHENARRAEESLIAVGLVGGTGGGDEDSVFVYAYKKNEHTNP